MKARFFLGAGLLLVTLGGFSTAQAPLAGTGTGTQRLDSRYDAPSVVLDALLSGPAGRWQVAGVPNAPWTFDLTVAGTALSGTIQQNGLPSGPVTIAAGRGEGPVIFFKALSPDGERIVEFIGRLSGNEISFSRDVALLPGGHRGANDLFGKSGPEQFTARRVTANRFNFKGVEVEVDSIKTLPNREMILESVRRQITIVDAAVTDPEQNRFFRSVPLTTALSVRADANNAAYQVNTKSVMLESQTYDPDQPVLLHELMHAYHDQKLANGFGNADVQRLYQQARSSGKFPADSYMLSNSAEYFAMMASVYLYGAAARDPFTRQAIREKQPDCYEWLVKEFGLREF